MYIYEDDNPNIIIKNLLQHLSIIQTKPNEIIIPSLEKASKKQTSKIAKKVTKKLHQKNCKEVVISKNLKKKKQFKNYLYSKNIEIADGKFLFKIMTENIIEYITSTSKINTKELKIAILANNIDRITLSNIKMIAKKYNNITLVTRRINRVKKLRNDLYEKNGIIITITNNKKKALTRSKIILNYDFPEEEINKFNIYEEAIIVNFEEKIKINKKRFNGINISDYEIELNSNKLKELVEYNEKLIEINAIKDIYEAQYFKEQSYESLKRNLKEDRCNIKKIIWQ